MAKEPATLTSNNRCPVCGKRTWLSLKQKNLTPLTRPPIGGPLVDAGYTKPWETWQYDQCANCDTVVAVDHNEVAGALDTVPLRKRASALISLYTTCPRSSG